MKGIILAGGTGSRLLPLTSVTNKHLLPVGRKPMILHSVKKLVDAKVYDIMIVTGTEHMGDMINLLGSGSKYGCNLTYRVQDEADGIAGALKLCKDFAGKDDIIVLLCDNVFEKDLNVSISKFKEKRKQQESLCLLNIKSVEDPERYGVAEIKGDIIVSIEEKPDNPKSKFCVTGIYLYSSDVFEKIQELKMSNRGEYEITDVNMSYVKSNNCTFRVLDGWWTDAGTHDSYFQANIYCKSKEENCS